MVGRALRCAPRASGCGRNAPVLTPSAGSSNLPKLALGDFTRPFCIPHSAFCIRSRVAFGSQEGGYRFTPIRSVDIPRPTHYRWGLRNYTFEPMEKTPEEKRKEGEALLAAGRAK